MIDVVGLTSLLCEYKRLNPYYVVGQKKNPYYIVQTTIDRQKF